jgi:hypothetical protein
VVELSHRSHRLRRLEPITGKEPHVKRREISDEEFEGIKLWFDEIGLVEVEVVDEHPPHNFNPPLTKPNTHILVQVREIFSEPFSFFTH